MSINSAAHDSTDRVTIRRGELNEPKAKAFLQILADPRAACPPATRHALVRRTWILATVFFLLFSKFYPPYTGIVIVSSPRDAHEIENSPRVVRTRVYCRVAKTICIIIIHTYIYINIQKGSSSSDGHCVRTGFLHSCLLRIVRFFRARPRRGDGHRFYALVAHSFAEQGARARARARATAGRSRLAYARACYPGPVLLIIYRLDPCA